MKIFPKKYKLIFLALTWLISTGASLAQYSPYNHPELTWRSIETEHFTVHFHQGTERTARIVGGIAELVYEPVVTLYNYRPDGKIHWIIRDHDDYSNGVTYYYENKIEIWSKPLDFELRGTHHWLYDVVTHEFTHMIQLGAARKAPRWMPGIYFQYIGYEKEKRPDVLYGYPNRIASYPVAMTVVPMWFAEGTAQYQTRKLRHDWWDSHRDMMLRVRALDNDLLTWEEMGVFGKTSLGSESVYNQGYALVRYIADKWGEETLSRLTGELGRIRTISFDQACSNVIGISGKQLYRQWSREIKQDYLEKTSLIRENPVSGRTVQGEGFANLYPSFSPDGKRIAFISNEGKDYLSLGRLVFYDFETGKITESKSPVKGDFDWSPDGKYIVYALRAKLNRHGSHFNDLYLWDVEKEVEIRLTKDARLSTPAFSPDGRSVAAIHHADGTHNLVLLHLPEITAGERDFTAKTVWEFLTQFDDGTQIFKPCFSADGKDIYVATADLGPRSIARFNITSGEFKLVIADEADNRDVTLSPDGLNLIYASDRTGIFNLYQREIETGEEQPLTNVTGGAFMASVAPDGRIAYSEFMNGGYKLKLLENPQAVDLLTTFYIEPVELERPNLASPPRTENMVSTYSTPFNKLFVLPRLTWDHGVFKPGFYGYTGDLLDKMTLFTGASFGKNGERDLYLNGEYRMLYPTLYLEAFNITRGENQVFEDPWKIIGEKMVDSLAVPIYGTYAIDYRFDLLELDLGGRIPMGDDVTLSAIFRYSKYRAVMKFDDATSFDYTYHNGRAYILRADTDQRALCVGRDIHPKGGWRGWLECSRENNRFLDGFEIEAEKGTIVEVYTPHNYERVESDIDYYWNPFSEFVINPRLLTGWISKSVDPFYHLYAGGLQGLRGYSFYSIGGTKRAAGRLTLRFPIATGIDKKLGPLYFDRIHGGLFFEAGDAWTHEFDPDKIKRDIGAELRMKLFSWYGFPTDVQLAGAYGLDRFTVEDETGRHEYGGDIRWYFTLLFDFL